MTRSEIIEKGERQLQFTADRLLKGNSTTIKKTIADEGLAQLDMLFLILDVNYEKYDYWFNKFYPYI